MSDEVTEEPAAAGDAATERRIARPAHEVLGAMLRRIRRTADLSQRQLTDALGVARSTVARAEIGERDMPVGLLARAVQLAGLELVCATQVAGTCPGGGPTPTTGGAPCGRLRLPLRPRLSRVARSRAPDG